MESYVLTYFLSQVINCLLIKYAMHVHCTSFLIGNHLINVSRFSNIKWSHIQWCCVGSKTRQRWRFWKVRRAGNCLI